MSLDVHFDVATQKSYDTYNNFVFDNNSFIFHKMATRIAFFNMIRDIPGDIVECGVFKGGGMALWLKMLMMHSPHDARKVIGFDFFSEKDCIENLDAGSDNNSMQKVFSRCVSGGDEKSDVSIQKITERLLSTGVARTKFSLVKGDLSETCKEFVDKNPGFKISLLYMDVDVEKPTYDALCTFWDRLSIGGVIVLDEYAIHIWSESKAVDKFLQEKKLILYKTNVLAPSAYIIKE